MNRKRSLENENALRRLDAKKKRLQRVMTDYIYYTHPKIYAEGVEFYKALDAAYPNKKDLRKTPQFLALQEGFVHCKTVEKSEVQQVTKEKKIVMDNFVLEIPLAKRKTSVQQTSVQQTSTITRAVETTATTTGPETTPTTSLAESTASGTTDLLPLDDATLQQIIEDLKNDTTLYQFFNDMEDTCDQDGDIFY